MTPELAKKVTPILQAYAEGKTIQYLGTDRKWHDEDNGYFDSTDLEDYEYRIKPITNMRPYNDEEEFIKASKEHGPYLHCIEEHAYYFPTNVDYHGIVVNGRSGKIDFENLLNMFFWQDKTPCGIEE